MKKMIGLYVHILSQWKYCAKNPILFEFSLVVVRIVHVAAACFGLSFFLYAQSLMLLPLQTRKTKMFYLLRIFSVPFSVVSYPITLATHAIHGIEYAFITHRMIQNSVATESEKKKFWRVISIACGLIIITLSAHFIVKYILGWKGFPLEMVSFFWILTRVNTFTHYWSDGVFFRMKEAATRKIVAPLLSATVK